MTRSPVETFKRLIGRLRRSVETGSPRPVRIDQLLRRPAVSLDTPELQRFIAGETVLVTGAGGSIGSEICRQIMRFCPKRLVLLEQAENNLFEIDMELRQRWVGAEIKPYVADICDVARVNRIFDSEHPQVVFHCAAHKHVPMMELNAGEAIKNNVFGTKTIADAAGTYQASAFVMVSTDKAVNPTSVMGAAKRCAELYIQSLNYRPAEGENGLSIAGESDRPGKRGTRYLAVRFGNVLGSSGSVVPTFQRQIAAGGPVTVTHPEMRRYFMTIPEASQLVLQAGAMGQGGEIFILDMGQPIRILDLALDLIKLSGLKPHTDIAIEFSGIRPGEKLYEELVTDDERTLPTRHRKIRIWQLAQAEPARVARMLARLEGVLDAPPEEVMAALSDCVPEYTPAGGEGKQSMRLVSDSQIRAA